MQVTCCLHCVKSQSRLQVRTAAWHQNDQLLLTAYIDQPGIRHAAAMDVNVKFKRVLT